MYNFSVHLVENYVLRTGRSQKSDQKQGNNTFAEALHPMSRFKYKTKNKNYSRTELIKCGEENNISDFLTFFT